MDTISGRAKRLQGQIEKKRKIRKTNLVSVSIELVELTSGRQECRLLFGQIKQRSPASTARRKKDECERTGFGTKDERSVQNDENEVQRHQMQAHLSPLTGTAPKHWPRETLK